MNVHPPAPDQRDNPFSTRHTRPGALPYQFPSGESLETLVARLAASGGSGEIIGPHGCGKSTLVATLAEGLSSNDRPVVVVRPTGNRLPDDANQLRSLPAGAVVFVDGFEQLTRWTRARLRNACQRRRLGLVITAHESCGFPLLMRIDPDLALAKQVVRSLIVDRETVVSDAQIARAFADAGGNVREMLFTLYDVVETSR